MEGQSDGGGEYIHRYSIRNDENGQRLTDSLQFVFMELAGFDKRLQDCKSFEDKFLYFFKNLPKFAMKPDTQNDSYFDELLAAAEYSNMTKAEQEAYNRRLKIQRDNYAADKYAREKAEKEFAEKLAQGLAEGRAEGEAAKARAIAKGLIEEGISIEVIQRVTGLSVEEVEALK